MRRRQVFATPGGVCRVHIALTQRTHCHTSPQVLYGSVWRAPPGPATSWRRLFFHTCGAAMPRLPTPCLATAKIELALSEGYLAVRPRVALHSASSGIRRCASGHPRRGINGECVVESAQGRFGDGCLADMQGAAVALADGGCDALLDRQGQHRVGSPQLFRVPRGFVAAETIDSRIGQYRPGDRGFRPGDGRCLGSGVIGDHSDCHGARSERRSPTPSQPSAGPRPKRPNLSSRSRRSASNGNPRRSVTRAFRPRAKLRRSATGSFGADWTGTQKDTAEPSTDGHATGAQRPATDPEGGEGRGANLWALLSIDARRLADDDCPLPILANTDLSSQRGPALPMA